MNVVTNTKCEKCIFKILDNSKQTGCIFNIDEIISKNYPGLYGIDNLDKSGETWILKNFKCTYARTQAWLEKLKEITGESPVERVLTDTIIPYYMVIILDSDQDDIIDILEDIQNNQSYKPNFISFILTQKSSYQPAEFAKLLQSYNLPKWKIHFITNTDMTLSEMIDMSLDTNISNVSASFIYIKYGDTVYKQDTIKRTNEIINHCIGKKVILCTDNFLDGLTIDKSLFINMNKQIGIVYDYLMNDNETYKIKML